MLGTPTVAVIGNVIVGRSGSSVVITRSQSGGMRSSGVNSTSKLKQKSLLIVKGKAGGFTIVKSSQPSCEPQTHLHKRFRMETSDPDRKPCSGTYHFYKPFLLLELRYKGREEPKEILFVKND